MSASHGFPLFQSNLPSALRLPSLCKTRGGCGVILLSLWLLLGCFPGTLQAQHRIIQTTGATNEGTIQGVSGGNVQVQIASGTINVPLRNVARVEMPEPPQVAQARDAYVGGDAAGAFQQIAGVADRFGGLPIPWARESVQIKAETALATGQIDVAKAGFALLEEIYQDKDAAAVGLARVDIAEGRTAEAAQVLEPLLTAALEDPEPDSVKGIQYGQVALAVGLLREKEGRYAEALEHYLQARAVFDSDPTTVSLAIERANKLREAHSVVVP